MLLTLESSDPRPLYQQIAGALRLAIADGRLSPGERLPAGRDLADSAGVTLETVQRAYRLLAEEGLVSARVGRGTVVASGIDPSRLTYRPQVEALVQRARGVDASLEEVLQELRRAWPQPPTPSGGAPRG